MYNAQDVTKRIKSKAKEKSITLKEMLSSLELGINALQNVSDKGIASFSLAKIADYLDCSVDYLLGRTDDPESHKQIKPVLKIENEPRYLVRRAGRDGSVTEEYLTKAEIDEMNKYIDSLEQADF